MQQHTGGTESGVFGNYKSGCKQGLSTGAAVTQAEEIRKGQHLPACSVEETGFSCHSRVLSREGKAQAL